MRNLHKWLLALGVATVLVTAIMFTQHSAKVNEQKLKSQMQKLEAQTKSQHDAEVENLKKQIQEQDSKYKQLEQSKAEEKARIAAQKAQERTLAQRVVQSAVPTANAAVRPVSGSCSEWMAAAGVTDMVNATELIRRESGCNPNAVNRSSGAFGIPQSLPASKIAHCGVDPVCQIQWMQNYVNARYGGWAGAVAWHNAHNWY